MLAFYLSCLVVGGFFVGLSAIGGLGKDADVDVDGDFDADGDADFDADGDADFDADGDADHDFDGDHDFDADHGFGGGDHEVGTSIADASHGGDESKRRKVWIPFLSFRFWTFGSAFFGLTGALLTLMSLTSEPMTAIVSGATGLSIGGLSAYLVRALRRPVSGGVELREYQGQVGELLLPLREGATGKLKVTLRDREREMLCVAADPVALPKGAKVVILRIDEEGRARVMPESEIYALEDTT